MTILLTDKKVATILEPRHMLELVDEYAAGSKRPKVFYQFKMYNDPRLNPELYGRKAGA